MVINYLDSEIQQSFISCFPHNCHVTLGKPLNSEPQVSQLHMELWQNTSLYVSVMIKLAILSIAQILAQTQYLINTTIYDYCSFPVC